MHERFRFKNKEELISKARSLGFNLPFQDDISGLFTPVTVDNHKISNRLVIQPMEGYDSSTDGSPSDLTRRRYQRYAEGGSGMIWVEAVAVSEEGRSNPHQLWLHQGNIDNYKSLCDDIRKYASNNYKNPFLVIQLTHSGRYSKPSGKAEPLVAQFNPVLDSVTPYILSDDELKKIQDKYIIAARLALLTGFDAIDIKACHGYLIHELLSSKERKRSIYGGQEPYKRFRFLLETLDRIKVEVPGIMLTVRLNIYDAWKGGFGISEDERIPDFTEPVMLIAELRLRGIRLLNITMGSPYYNPYIVRPFDTPLPGVAPPDEHPLSGVRRMIEGASEIQHKFADMQIVGSAYSYLRHFAPNVGAAIIKNMDATFVGFGRNSFAYPSMANDLMVKGIADPDKVCIGCSGCSRLIKNLYRGGCVIRDREIYGAELKKLIADGKNKLLLGEYELDYYSINTLVIGSGAASLNAALNLHLMNQKDILIATDKWGGGTSNNAGSDKQTYYKLSLAGSEPDSTLKMAEDLFNGKCMHGDIALCEAQGSVAGFMNLIRLGVPFPQNRYGAWVGYKTDHDPRARASSAGPYTSHKMFEALASEVKRNMIRVLDRHQVIALLTSSESNDSKKITGALAINLKEKDPLKAFVLFNAVNVILGTGGPGGIYENSVYPLSQTGSSGMAYEAGATGQNLTESQFGIASVKFRWNLSGSYQQVIPRYFSTDQNGNDEKEFLYEFFPDINKLSRAIFLKGYQWPFDPRKIADYGSSMIDLLVYRETIQKNRKVYLDYTRNLTGQGKQKFFIKKLDAEVYTYLKNSSAIYDTPYKRLKAMNSPAIDLYLHHNIDLKTQPLEISVCAQHNNGGLKGNIWWESDLKHLFPVGEANGSHGVYRPGGSALNSGQVGSYRAALFISTRYNQKPPDQKNFISKTRKQIEGKLQLASKWRSSGLTFFIDKSLKEIQHRMSSYGGIIRNKTNIEIAVMEAKNQLNILKKTLSALSVRELASTFRLIDLCRTHYLYLEAIKTYIEAGGRSRGSFLVTDKKGFKPEGIPETDWNFSVCTYDKEIEKNIIEISYKNEEIETKIVKVRPIPDQELWFEKVWKKNLEDNLTES